jgi:hypothetical protein
MVQFLVAGAPLCRIDGFRELKIEIVQRSATGHGKPDHDNNKNISLRFI